MDVYREAVAALQAGELSRARVLFQRVLDDDVTAVTRVSPPCLLGGCAEPAQDMLEQGQTMLTSPMVALRHAPHDSNQPLNGGTRRFSALKQFGDVLAELGKAEAALDAYLEAADIGARGAAGAPVAAAHMCCRRDAVGAHRQRCTQQR